MRRETDRGSGRLGFLGPVAAFVLVLTLCCGVVTCVFLRAQDITARAKLETAAATLCRNAAERFRVGDCPEDGTVLYYDEDLHPAAPEQGVYRLEFSRADQTEPGGVLRTAVIRGGPAEGEAIYQLVAASYAPGEDGA